MGKTYDSTLKAHGEALDKALDYCKKQCNNKDCSAFFFQKHGDGHEMCGFYMDAVDLNFAVQKHGHQKCSQSEGRGVPGLEPFRLQETCDQFA